VKKEAPPPKADKKEKAAKGTPVPLDQVEFTKLEIKVVL
jgi:hypothetical protein